jgi:hypothetical protein
VSINSWDRPRQGYGCDGVEASQPERGGEGWDDIDVASSESVGTVEEWYRFGVSVARSQPRGNEKWGINLRSSASEKKWKQFVLGLQRNVDFSILIRSEQFAMLQLLVDNAEINVKSANNFCPDMLAYLERQFVEQKALFLASYLLVNLKGRTASSDL